MQGQNFTLRTSGDQQIILMRLDTGAGHLNAELPKRDVAVVALTIGAENGMHQSSSLSIEAAENTVMISAAGSAPLELPRDLARQYGLQLWLKAELPEQQYRDITGMGTLALQASPGLAPALTLREDGQELSFGRAHLPEVLLAALESLKNSQETIMIHGGEQLSVSCDDDQLNLTYTGPDGFDTRQLFRADIDSVVTGLRARLGYGAAGRAPGGRDNTGGRDSTPHPPSASAPASGLPEEPRTAKAASAPVQDDGARRQAFLEQGENR